MFQNSHCSIFINNSDTGTFLLRTHKAEGVRGLSRPSFVRALIPCIGAPPSQPNHLPKAPLPDISTLETGLQHMRFEGMRSAYSTPGVCSSQTGSLLVSWVSEWVSEVAQLCPTLCEPVDCSLPVSSIHGILQARIVEWLPFPSPGDLPYPGIEPGSPALWADALSSKPPGKPMLNTFNYNSDLSLREFLGRKSEGNWATHRKGKEKQKTHEWEHPHKREMVETSQ